MSIELFKKIIEICSREQMLLVDSLNETRRDTEGDILKIKKRIDHINLIIEGVTNYLYLLKEQDEQENNYTKS
jgi:hypothetical protein